MRILLLLIAVCLTSCATHLTVVSPPVPASLIEPCADKIADPLSTADQYDVARALAQAVRSARECSERQSALIEAIKTREKAIQAIVDAENE